MTRNARNAAMRILTIAAAALAALMLTIALTNAQEPPETQTATRLEPGINLVGWVGEPTSTSQLFREIPQLESIWAWDAELDDWIVAGRGAPEWVGGLGRVWAGMGLRLILGGEEPFVWQRSTEPTRGLVELRTGWNLVAWSGADGAPIEQVAKGIGWSLRELRRWNAANQHWTTWTSPERSAQLIATSATDQGATDEESQPATVRRGEALWINTARSVNWLQPTDILPRLVFPGGASDELQARVREDLESVLAFFGQQYGIQANPTDFTIYIHKDADALIQAFKDEGAYIDDATAAAIRAGAATPGVTAGGDIVIPQTHWPEDPSIIDDWARHVLTHEYFHVLQEQLSHWWTSQWLSEGTAEWAGSDHQVFYGSDTWEDAREGRASAVTKSTPSLRSTEIRNANWQYTLGWLATDRLTKAAGDGSYIEFWRRLASTEIGPHGRWASTPDWRTAFQETFGVPVSSFYAEFGAWQREQAVANEATASPTGDDDRWIRGRATDEGGAPVAGVFVNAIRVEGETSVGWNQRAETGVDGTFAVRAPEEGDYRISIDIADDCTRYYRNSNLTEEPDEALPVTVAESDLQDVNIQLPADICGWLIRGRVADAAGEPFAGASITICETTTHTCTWNKSTKLDGSFAISAPIAGEYHLSLDLTDHCEVYFRTAGVALSSSDASLITVAGADVDGLTLRVPDNVCAYQITGSVSTADGQPLANTYIGVVRQVNGRSVGRSFVQNTDADGSFAITVHGEAAYEVSFSLEGCWLYFSAAGITPDWDQRLPARVFDRDLQLAPRQIPQDLCALRRISGSITAADGQPLANAYISACHESDDGPCAGRRTESDGSFSITVAEEGAYSLSFNLDGCTIHFRARGFTTSREERGTARVEGRDVQLNPRQIPQGMCAMGRISGNVATADGQPFAGAYISACREVDSGPCAGDRTGSDGSFSITVPEAGAYRLWFSLDGCSSLIYFNAHGFTTEREDRLMTHVADREVRLDARRIPADLCPRIIGRVAKSDGQPLSGAYIEACREVDGVCVESARGRIGYDGSFAIAVPAVGSYRLGYNLDDCELYYGPTGLTSNAADAMRFDAGDRDLQVDHRLVTNNLCAYQINGVVVSADGGPLTEAQVAACEYVDGECVSDVVYGQVADDGRFAMTVPVDGAYRLILELSHCSFYFGQEELTSNRSDAWLFQVAGQDVRLSQRQAPTEPCSQPVNSQQISGEIAKSDGQPLSDTYISVCREVDNRCAWFGGITDADGSFAITVPADGRYQVSFNLGGCTIYFRAGGFTTSYSERSTARVAGRDARLNPRQIPAEMCAHRISGRFVDANGAPLAERWINANGSGGVWTDANGCFEIRVPSDDSYTFDVWLTDDCNHQLEGQALGSPDNPVRVSGADVTGVELRLPGAIEELCG